VYGPAIRVVSRASVEGVRVRADPTGLALVERSIAAISLAERVKSNRAKFSRIRSGRIDLGKMMAPLGR
jgi:hypothetical protein